MAALLQERLLAALVLSASNGEELRHFGSEELLAAFNHCNSCRGTVASVPASKLCPVLVTLRLYQAAYCCTDVSCKPSAVPLLCCFAHCCTYVATFISHARCFFHTVPVALVLQACRPCIAALTLLPSHCRHAGPAVAFRL